MDDWFVKPTRSLLLMTVIAGLLQCSESTGDGKPGTLPGASDEFFVERLHGSGLDFVHDAGRTGHKHLPEINSGCVAVLDFDGDGLQDLCFGQGGPLQGDRSGDEVRDRLYRNEGGFRFRDVTEETGAFEPGYTFHVAAPDYDGDGDQDLYFCNYGGNRLLRNDQGSFTDVTEETGIGSDRWSTAAAFADFDGDGDLDLFLGNYCEYSFEHAGCEQVVQGVPVRSYCNPDTFPGARDQLFRNENGRFVDISPSAGMEESAGTALAVTVSDFDDDGDLDLFVANDGRPNALWRNDGDMKFTDIAWDVGVAVAESGLSEACMGSDFADLDRDGDFDLVVANLAMETNTFYRNADGMFEDKSTLSGLGPPSLRFVGFGCEAFDFDNDRDVDVVVSNGHVLDNVHEIEPSQTFAQVPHLYVNDGRGRFEEKGADHGAYFQRPRVGRGLAAVDLDNDGDLDLVVAHNDGEPVLLENRQGNRRSWIGFQLRATGRNPLAIGAKVTVRGGGLSQVEEVRGASSYSAYPDLRLHFGLGQQSVAEEAIIRWPDGEVQRLSNLRANQYHTVTQGANSAR